MSAFITDPKTGKSTAAFQMTLETNIWKAEALLRGIPGGAETALDKAILKARRDHSKLAREAIVREYNISDKSLTKTDGGKKRITPKFKKTVRAAGHGFIHEIIYSGHVIPLAEFHHNPTDRRVGRPRAIWKTTWKGHPADLYHFKESRSPNIHVEKQGRAQAIRRAFVAKVQAGKSDTFHTGIFERTEERASVAAYDIAGRKVLAINGDSTIAQKYGPSVEHMIGNEKVRTVVDAEMGQRVEARLNEAISKILEGKISV